MKVQVPRVLAVAAALAAAALVPSADDYQCMAAEGCVAITSDPGGGTRKVKFRRGDIVSTESGWVVNPNDGWSPVD